MMIRTLSRPGFAAACALLCAACGESESDAASAALRADSAFSAPVTVRVPSAIRVTANWTTGPMNGLSGVEHYGPAEYHRLNPPMNVLSAAGMLRFTDRSRRGLVNTQHFGYSVCAPYESQAGCGRSSERKIYHYAHDLQVIPIGTPGAEWREDAAPWEASFASAGIDYTPGWVVELGRRELAEVRQVRTMEEGRIEVDYTWRWALTPAGTHFDQGGAILRSLPAELRRFAITGVMDGIHADTAYAATATLERRGKGWEVTRLGLWQ